MDFSCGDRVQLKDDKNGEIFTVSQVDDSRHRCWIGDENGSGWYVYFNQIILVDDEDYQSSPDDFEE